MTGKPILCQLHFMTYNVQHTFCFTAAGTELKNKSEQQKSKREQKEEKGQKETDSASWISNNVLRDSKSSFFLPEKN